jgi:hypothetical protein
MIANTHGERRERVASCYISRFDTLEEMTLQGMKDPARSPHDSSSQSECSTCDCVLVFDAGSWHRTSHRMTMTCCTM